MLRIKAVLIFKRNATRHYLDFVALAETIGADTSVAAMRSFDALYPQPNGESALMQLVVQLASPMPYDLDAIELAEYKKLDAKCTTGLASGRCADACRSFFSHRLWWLRRCRHPRPIEAALDAGTSMGSLRANCGGT